MSGWDGTIATLNSFAPPPATIEWSASTSFDAGEVDPYEPDSRIQIFTNGGVFHRRTTGSSIGTVFSGTWASDYPDFEDASLYEVRFDFVSGNSHPAGSLDSGRGVWLPITTTRILHSSGGVAVGDTDVGIYSIQVRLIAGSVLQFSQNVTISLTKGNRS